LLQSFAIWSLALVGGPFVLLHLDHLLGANDLTPLRQPAVAIASLVGFSLLNVATGLTLAIHGRGTPLPVASPRELVTTGPYRYVRNPMAIAGIGQGIAIGLWFGSPCILLYAVAGAALWHAFVRPAEEKDLSARFGRAYDSYRASVPLWWPRSRPFDAPAL
jgi:protein-S-isoprenylcysteine O-methyltransferase Ste14